MFLQKLRIILKYILLQFLEKLDVRVVVSPYLSGHSTIVEEVKN